MKSFEQTAQPAERTKHEACMDVLYGIKFNDMNERFYRRLDGLFSVITLISGSAVFVSFLTKTPLMSGIIGIIIAIIAYMNREIRPAEKAILCANHRAKFGELASVMSSLTLEEIDARLRILQSNAPATIDALAIPAFQANLISNGYEKDDSLRAGYLSKIAVLLA